MLLGRGEKKKITVHGPFTVRYRFQNPGHNDLSKDVRRMECFEILPPVESILVVSKIFFLIMTRSRKKKTGGYAAWEYSKSVLRTTM